MSSSQLVSKLGIHSVGPRRGGYGDLLNALKAAGRRLSVVKCREDFGAAWEARQLWPETLTIGASDHWNGFPFDYGKFRDMTVKNSHIDYWERFNEINGDWDNQANAYLDLLPKAKADGLRLCLFSAADGTPQYPEIDPAPYAAILKVCRFVLDKGYDAILGVHEYGSATDINHVGRYRRLADFLEANQALLPIVVTEFGPQPAGRIDPAAMLAYVQAVDEQDMRDPRLIGRALWTTGGGWIDNFGECLLKIAPYLATVGTDLPHSINFQGNIQAQYQAELAEYLKERGGTIAFN